MNYHTKSRNYLRGVFSLKQYDAKKILNIALAGHSGCGKTSVAESMLYLAKASDRLGKVADGNTTLDFDSEEIKRQASIMTAVAPIEWKGTKINLIDTPGLFDFAGGVAEGMRAADTALIVVSGKDGVSVGTEKAVEAATKANLTKVILHLSATWIRCRPFIAMTLKCVRRTICFVVGASRTNNVRAWGLMIRTASISRCAVLKPVHV